MDYVLAVDLGGTQLRAALVGHDGALAAHQRMPTRVHEGPLAVVGRVLTLIATVRAALPAGACLHGIGIAAPGPLDPTTGMIYAPPNMPGWDAFPLCRLISEATGLPVTLGNDANAAALAEWRFGAGRGLQNLVYVTVSTGIGSGVICDGHLLLGRLGAGGELGFLLLDSEHGLAWEDLASGTALARTAAHAMVEYPESLLHQHADPSTISAAHVAAAARQGDSLAVRLMERESRLLGMGFASILQIFSPELLLVGGGVILGNPELLNHARAVAYAHVKVPLYRDVPILLASLGEAVGLLGAATLAFASLNS